MKNKARNTDSITSHTAAKDSNSTAAAHRLIIISALKKKPNQTGYELKTFIRQNYKSSQWLTYHQIMRRLSEVAVKIEIRECKSGKPKKDVNAWGCALVKVGD